jgi:hypothetical protein
MPAEIRGTAASPAMRHSARYGARRGRRSIRQLADSVQPFFSALIETDPSSESWLGKLLTATPHGAFLGPPLEGPGTLLSSLTSPTDRGHLACFEYPVHPPRSLLAWFVDHPDALVWPKKRFQKSSRWLLGFVHTGSGR